MNLGKLQKGILVGYITLVLVICVLYVPWTGARNYGLPNEPIGYGSLWQPPQQFTLDKNNTYFVHKQSVDISRVGLELVALTIICGILLVLTVKSKE